MIVGNLSQREYLGWKCVFGGFVIHLVLGSFYCWGNITTAVTSYLRLYEDVHYYQSIFIFAAQAGFQGIFMSVGGILEGYLGARYTILFGGAIMSIGTMLASLTTRLWGAIICYGILFGTGMGIAYSPPISSAVKYLPEYKGLITGIIVAGFGGGAFVFGNIAMLVANPHKENVDKDTGYFDDDSSVPENVPKMFVVLGVCFWIFIFLGSMCISEVSLDIVEKSTSTSEGYDVDNISQVSVDNPMNTVELGDKEIEMMHDRKRNLNGTSYELIDRDRTANSDSGNHDHCNANADTIWGFISLPISWHIATCFVATSAGGMYLCVTFKTYGEEYIPNETYMTVIAEVAAVFNAVGRVFWGYFADKTSNFTALLCLSFSFAIVILTYSNVAVWLGQPGYALWSFALFFCEGGNFALYMPLVIEIFGKNNCGRNYGLVFSLYSMFVVLNTVFLSELEVNFGLATFVIGLSTLIGVVNVYLLKVHYNVYMLS